MSRLLGITGLRSDSVECALLPPLDLSPFRLLPYERSEDVQRIGYGRTKVAVPKLWCQSDIFTPQYVYTHKVSYLPVHPTQILNLKISLQYSPTVLPSNLGLLHADRQVRAASSSSQYSHETSRGHRVLGEWFCCVCHCLSDRPPFKERWTNSWVTDIAFLSPETTICPASLYYCPSSSRMFTSHRQTHQLSKTSLNVGVEAGVVG